MSIRELKPGVFHIRVRRTMPNGKVKNATQTFKGTKKEARRIELKLSDGLDRQTGSLTKPIKTVKDVLDYYLQVKGDSISYYAIRAVYDRITRDIGQLNVTHASFRSQFARYWVSLDTIPSKRVLGKMISNSHKNKILKLLNVSLETCRKHGFIKENPIYRCFDYHSEMGDARDRVFSEEEITVLLETMKEHNSYLYWPFKFSLKNPIRKDDTRLLTKESFNMLKPWIRFKPKKTQKGYGPKWTTLLELDDELRAYLHSVPVDCPYLFYRLVDGAYRDLGNFNSHWRSCLRWARAKKPDDKNFLKDVKWHDTKHNAITWMLDNGYDPLDLKNLGIQFSQALIDRYYHFNAEKVLSRKQKSVSKLELMAQAVAQ